MQNLLAASAGKQRRHFLSDSAERVVPRRRPVVGLPFAPDVDQGRQDPVTIALCEGIVDMTALAADIAIVDRLIGASRHAVAALRLSETQGAAVVAVARTNRAMRAVHLHEPSDRFAER